MQIRNQNPKAFKERNLNRNWSNQYARTFTGGTELTLPMSRANLVLSASARPATHIISNLPNHDRSDEKSVMN